MDQARAAIESVAQGVLDARAQFPGSSLADLYDPLTMPPGLLKAHRKLDAANPTKAAKPRNVARKQAAKDAA